MYDAAPDPSSVLAIAALYAFSAAALFASWFAVSPALFAAGILFAAGVVSAVFVITTTPTSEIAIENTIAIMNTGFNNFHHNSRI